MGVGVSVVSVLVPVLVLHRVSFFLQSALFVVGARRLRGVGLRTAALHSAGVAYV